MSSTVPDSLRELAAGYALGALSAEEAQQFEAALARSPDLAREVAEYREVNALLATGAGTATPDPTLRDRLIARIRESKVVPLAPRRPPIVPLLALGLAASAVLAAGLGLRVRSLGGQLRARDSALGVRDSVLAEREGKLAARERTLNTLLEAEADLAIAHLTTTGPNTPGIQLFWNRKASSAVLHAFRLPPAPAGRVYQLWFMRDGVPVPSQTFNSDPDGHALVQAFTVPEGGGFGAAAVTIEPEGGSPAPTTPVLLFGAIVAGS
jgi:anti-sigma-K factor RskA